MPEPHGRCLLGSTRVCSGRGWVSVAWLVMQDGYRLLRRLLD